MTAQRSESDSEMRSETKPVYLSPHLDDAVLSCGGLIHQQAQRGLQPLVITCFAGVPDYRVLSPFATELHHLWSQPEEPVELRRHEDVNAMAYLGAAYEHWDDIDCIYRRHPDSGEFLYGSEATLFGEVHREDYHLVGALTRRLSTSLPVDRTFVCAPLSVGHHVDHQIVSQAAYRLHGQGFQVRFYEDYPYAEDPQKLQLALRHWALEPVPVVEILEGRDLRAKVAAIRLYHSQLRVLFGSESAVAERVESHASAVAGGSGCGERYWEGGTK